MGTAELAGIEMGFLFGLKRVHHQNQDSVCGRSNVKSALPRCWRKVPKNLQYRRPIEPRKEALQFPRRCLRSSSTSYASPSSFLARTSVDAGSYFSKGLERGADAGVMHSTVTRSTKGQRWMMAVHEGSEISEAVYRNRTCIFVGIFRRTFLL